MNESDDLEKGPSTQKPAEEFRLPARLRDKLGDAGTGGGGGDDDEWEPARRSPAGLIVTIVIIVLVIAGGGWWYQNHQAQVKAEAARVAAVAAREKAVADSIAAAAAYADSVAAAVRADSIATFNKLPKWKQRQIVAAQAKAAAESAKPAGGAATTAGAAASSGTAAKPSGGEAPAGSATEEPQEAGPFALDAGQFLFESPAQKAAEALKGSTGLDAMVSAVGSGENATYHVYLGKFSNRAAASRAASDLLAKGVVQQAIVVAAPK